MQASLRELMDRTGVRFGTSGARGLVTELTDLVAHAYTRGFLQYLAGIGEFPASGGKVAIAGDLRPSTGRILAAVAAAVGDLGHEVVNAGRIPSPALALYGFDRRIPTVMVTGSHIPADRNGIKFNKPSGEVLKEDEAGIAGQVVTVEDGRFGVDGGFLAGPPGLPPVDPDPLDAYVARYAGFFPDGCLGGVRLGVYEHSAVGREVIARILEGLGATVTRLGRSEEFVPVDTEAIRPEDVRLAREWASPGGLDAIVSADGDSDRPLISDESGEWIRGDVAGILAARYLGADSVSVPVSCNTAVEACGAFGEVRRTRIGSPYVVASMMAATASGRRCVVGYEANGGFLLGSDLRRGGRVLRALPTRDAVLVMITLLLAAREAGVPLSGLVRSLPARFTASVLLKPCPAERAAAILARYPEQAEAAAGRRFAEDFPGGGAAVGIDRTDGLRVLREYGEILHLRPSGNAPEFRCYTEATTPERAAALAADALERLRRMASGT